MKLLVISGVANEWINLGVIDVPDGTRIEEVDSSYFGEQVGPKLAGSLSTLAQLHGCNLEKEGVTV